MSGIFRRPVFPQSSAQIPADFIKPGMMGADSGEIQKNAADFGNSRMDQRFYEHTSQKAGI